MDFEVVFAPDPQLGNAEALVKGALAQPATVYVDLDHHVSAIFFHVKHIGFIGSSRSLGFALHHGLSVDEEIDPAFQASSLR